MSLFVNYIELFIIKKRLNLKTKSVSNSNKIHLKHSPNFNHSIQTKNTSSPNQTLDNQEIQRMIKYGIIQPKLKISHTDDSYEREADRVAKQIMRMSVSEDETQIQNKSGNKIQRKCSSCEMKNKEMKEEKEELKISRKSKPSYNNLEITR